jgi:hypothetical protein
MTPTSAKPISKVTYGAVAAALATVLLAVVKHYVWPTMPADLEGPLDTLLVASVAGLASLAAGYMKRLEPGEIKPLDAVIVEQQAKP